MTRNDAQRTPLTEEEKRERMTALARTFPSLEPCFSDAALVGLDPWDASKLAVASDSWTYGRQQIVAFLLTVWNSKQALSSAFNLIEATSKWDTGDRAALVAWALEPFSF